MKNKIIFLVILTIGLLSVVLFIRENRDIITTKRATTITLWDNYIIFEDYRGVFPPNCNYIKTSKIHADYGYVRIIRRKDFSIVVETDRSTIEVNLPNTCQINILNSCADTILPNIICNDESVDLIVDCYAHRGHYVPIITEYVQDSIITTEFEQNCRFFTLTSLGEKHISTLVNSMK